MSYVFAGQAQCWISRACAAPVAHGPLEVVGAGSLDGCQPGGGDRSRPLRVASEPCEQERGRRAMMARWPRCCKSRWRKFWTSGVALRGGGFKPPTGALAEDRGVERRGKRRERSRQVWAEKLSDGLEMVLCRLRRRKAIK